MYFLIKGIITVLITFKGLITLKCIFNNIEMKEKIIIKSKIFITTQYLEFFEILYFSVSCIARCNIIIMIIMKNN